MPDGNGDSQGSGGELRGNGPWPERAGGVFTDSNKHMFFYDSGGYPRSLGLYVNGEAPWPASVPDVKGLAPAGTSTSVSAQGVMNRGLWEGGAMDSGSTSPGTGLADDPVSYNVGSSDYQIAARKAFSDYLDAVGRGDAQAVVRAQRALAANPPDYLKPDTGPQMRAYDPGAEALQAQRFQSDMLGAVSLPAAWSSGAATMLGKDEETRRRWMEGGAEIGSELAPFAAGAAGILSGETRIGVTTPTRESLLPASRYSERLNQTPKKNGRWVGPRGESTFYSFDPKINSILGGRGIPFRNSYPDFSAVSMADVRIADMSTNRQENFAKADQIIADELHMPEEDVVAWRRSNGFVWHEHEDTRTMQLVPSIINYKFGHMGGVGELKRMGH